MPSRTQGEPDKPTLSFLPANALTPGVILAEAYGSGETIETVEEVTAIRVVSRDNPAVFETEEQRLRREAVPPLVTLYMPDEQVMIQDRPGYVDRA